MSAYVRIASWHAVRAYTPAGSIRTRCGLRAVAPHTVSDHLPLAERSCETCLRLVTRDAEKAAE